MGVFEMPPFDRGTVALAKAVADSGAVSVVGGGDSEKAIKSAGVSGKITHVSTGGGASLEFLSGMELPGVAALTEK
jgi:phosphoglycerate kinase